jgi:hypothetical protein
MTGTYVYRDRSTTFLLCHRCTSYPRRACPIAMAYHRRRRLKIPNIRRKPRYYTIIRHIHRRKIRKSSEQLAEATILYVTPICMPTPGDEFHTAYPAKPDTIPDGFEMARNAIMMTGMPASLRLPIDDAIVHHRLPIHDRIRD